MPRLKPKFYTPAQRAERRALQAARAILAQRSVYQNELRVMRHVETLAPGDRYFWLLRTLGDAHPSAVGILAVYAQSDIIATEEAPLPDGSCAVTACDDEVNDAAQEEAAAQEEEAEAAKYDEVTQ